MKDQTIHYCKYYKATGMPIVVTDVETDKVRITDGWARIFYDKQGSKWRVSVKFNNAKGRAKRQGATSLLRVEKIG